MSGTDSSDSIRIISNQHLLTSEAFQNLTHSEQINYLKQHLLTAEAVIKTQKTNQRHLEKLNRDLQKDKQYKNQLITTLRGKIRSTSKSLKNQIEESLRSNNIQILTTELNSALNTEILRLRSKIDTADRNNLHIFDRHPQINNQIDHPVQHPVEHRPASPPASPLSR